MCSASCEAFTVLFFRNSVMLRTCGDCKVCHWTLMPWGAKGPNGFVAHLAHWQSFERPVKRRPQLTFLEWHLAHPGPPGPTGGVLHGHPAHPYRWKPPPPYGLGSPGAGLGACSAGCTPNSYRTSLHMNLQIARCGRGQDGKGDSSLKPGSCHTVSHCPLQVE